MLGDDALEPFPYDSVIVGNSNGDHGARETSLRVGTPRCWKESFSGYLAPYPNSRRGEMTGTHS
jgi:hypothetical protein